MKSINVLLLSIVLFLQVLQGKAQQLKAPALLDSLNDLLNYFKENTSDATYPEALKNATTLCNQDAAVDSLVSTLIQSEDVLINMFSDSGIIGRYPFKQEKLLALGEATMKLSALVLPGKENLLYAAALHNMGIFVMLSDASKAHEFFEEALAIRKKISGEEDAAYVKTLVSLAFVYDAEGKKDMAYKTIFQSLATTSKTKGIENSLYADELFCLANFYNQIKTSDTAALLYEQELSLRRRMLGDTNARLALYLCRTALVYFYTGQYKKAFALYREAAAITQRALGEENFQYAWCLSGIGSAHYREAEYEKAIPYFNRSLEIERKLCAEGFCTNDIPVNLHNLATTYQCLGKYEKALPLFQEAVSIEKANQKNDNGFPFDMPYLAILYEMTGKYKEAFELINETTGVMQKLKKEYGIDYIRTLNFLGVSYTTIKEYGQAIAVLKKALHHAEEIYGTQNIEYAATLNHIGIAYKGLFMYDTAVRLISEAAAIRKNLVGDEHPDYATALNDLGDLYVLMGNYDAATALYIQALNIRKKAFGEEHPDYTASLTSLALLNIIQNNIPAATGLLIKSNSLALNHIAQTFTSLSEREKIGYVINQSSQFCYLPSLLFTQSTMNPEMLQQVYTNELALKGMALNDQQIVLNSIRKSNDKSGLELYNKWCLNKIYSGKQLLQTIQARSDQLDSIIEVTNQMEQELSRVSAVFRQQQQMLTSKNISESLLPGETAIEFLKFQYYNKNFTDSILYAALIILPGDSTPKFVPLFEEKQLIDLLNLEGKNANSINRFYAANANNNKQFTNSGNALYSLIWKPLEKYLPGIHTVYYTPSGLLCRIAFNALHVDETGQSLIDRYRLHYLLSIRSVALPLTVTQKPSAINIWGDIEYNDKKASTANRGYDITQKNTDTYNAVDLNNDTVSMQVKKWAALSGTRLEMNNIKNIFNEAGISVSTITDTAATEEAFKAMDGKSPPVLHIATHGFFWTVKSNPGNNFAMQQDPMFRSGLVLAGCNTMNNKRTIEDKEDGILTSYEIAQLDLSNTDVVVLSACETALGDLEGNEGVIGLQRAFKLTGVKQIIISLWRIPDKQTAELMSLFYRNWLTGQIPREALRSAQLIMKKKYPAYDWAGFVLIE